MKKFRVTLNEHQLRLISQCVEDCHRFMAGDLRMQNSTCCLKGYHKIGSRLNELKPLVTPTLQPNAHYDWAGNCCPDKNQRKFIAETYYIYREILHQLTDPNDTWNVYSGFTLRCEDSGEPIIIEEIKDEKVH
jgi:hypothetical protein